MNLGEKLARRFHETYERLAPSFGYETRTETRQFDPTTPNGRLMIAVCTELSNEQPIPDSAAPDGGDVEQRARELLARELDAIRFPAMAAEIRDTTGYNTLGAAMVRVVTAALRQPAQVGAGPDGWVLVPREPTEQMIEAAMQREDDEPLSDWGRMVPAPHAEIYKAMLAATPQAAPVPVEGEAAPYCWAHAGELQVLQKVREGALNLTIKPSADQTIPLYISRPPEQPAAQAGAVDLISLLAHAEAKLRVYSEGAGRHDTELSCMILPTIRRVLAAPQAAPVPVEGEGREPFGWFIWVEADKGNGYQETFTRSPVLAELVKHSMSGAVQAIPLFEDAPPPEQPAVELEEFREAVDLLRLVSLSGKRDCERHNTHPHDFDRSLEKANRLLALLDGAKAGKGDGS
jgi:hypothetical protein